MKINWLDMNGHSVIHVSGVYLLIWKYRYKSPVKKALRHVKSAQRGTKNETSWQFILLYYRRSRNRAPCIRLPKIVDYVMSIKCSRKASVCKLLSVQSGHRFVFLFSMAWPKTANLENKTAIGNLLRLHWQIASCTHTSYSSSQSCYSLQWYQ